jgi:uncharacterized protein (DUF362 family)
LRSSYQECVSAFECHDVRQAYAIVREGFESQGVELSCDDRVVLKPNLCALRTSETGTTTDPALVEAIIRHLREAYGISRVSIVESDGTQVLADMAFKLLGYERLSKRLGVQLVNLSKSSFTTKHFPQNTFLKEIAIPRVMETADFLISVPKIKTHELCWFTGALKNQFGCNPYPRKDTYHKRLHDAIVDLNNAFKPDLVVVDGIVGMEGGGGPIGGTPIRTNSLFFGRDPVATDHFIATTMGIDPRRVGFLVEARRRGLGTTQYETVGASAADLKTGFRTSSPRWHNLYGLLTNVKDEVEL